jgi:AraC-like DNA-binding protein
LFAAHSGEIDKLVKKVERQIPFFVDRAALSYTPYMQSLIDSLWSCPFKGSLKKLFMEVRAMELLLLQWELFAQPLAPAGVLKNKTDIEKIYLAREILTKNIHQPPTLTQLAKLCGLNEFKLKNGFRQVFGSTVFGCFNDMRLQQAMRLIRHTGKSFTEIAYETGYAHPQHFYRAFRRQFGITPGQARLR